jgi:ribosome silencing factor RsfS/YbeB/iojap
MDMNEFAKYCSRIDDLEEYLRHNLKQSRYDHSLRVQEMAIRLSDHYGADISKASFAGRYHDIAKCFDREKMDEYIVKYGLPDELLGNPALAHSKVGAAVLEREFGVSDEEILDAVRYHTTARAGMTLLDEIIYVADVVEDGRTFTDLKYYQDLAFNDLDQCALEILIYTIGDVTSKGRALDRDTSEAKEYLEEKRYSIKEKQMEIKEIAQAIADLLNQKKARDIVMIDIAEKSSFADYFINATGGSERQLGALADDVEDKLAELGITPKSKEGRPETGWILVDGGDIIINLFTAETRDKYTLEKIWNDCESILVG